MNNFIYYLKEKINCVGISPYLVSKILMTSNISIRSVKIFSLSEIFSPPNLSTILYCTT